MIRAARQGHYAFLLAKIKEITKGVSFASNVQLA
jgi:pseudouridine-5'-phosphate glycosidase